MKPERGTSASCDVCEQTITWVGALGGDGAWLHDQPPADGHEPRPAPVALNTPAPATAPTAGNPWALRAAREAVAGLEMLFRAGHLWNSRYLDNGPITTCRACTPPGTADEQIQAWLSGDETAFDAGPMMWPCKPLRDAGMTIDLAGVLVAGFNLGKDSMREEHQELSKWKKMVLDLDRCPHGRHEGDVCAGWRGPGRFDGGCRGGWSLGNPALETGQIMGTGLSGSHIYAHPAREQRNNIEAWRYWLAPDHPAGVNRPFEYAYRDDKPDDELTQLRDTLRDANQALFRLGAGPFLPGVGQLPRLVADGPDIRGNTL